MNKIPHKMQNPLENMYRVYVKKITFKRNKVYIYTLLNMYS